MKKLVKENNVEYVINFELQCPTEEEKPMIDVEKIGFLLTKANLFIYELSHFRCNQAQSIVSEIINYLKMEDISSRHVEYYCIALINEIAFHTDFFKYNESNVINVIGEIVESHTKEEKISLIEEFFGIYIMGLKRKHDNSHHSKSAYISYIKGYIKEHYREDISFSELASELHLSRNYLSYLFKNETGYSFTDYLIQYRIEKAKRLMSNQELMIYEISEKVGYKDPAYFSRIFKSVTGKSPSYYKNYITKEIQSLTVGD